AQRNQGSYSTQRAHHRDHRQRSRDPHPPRPGSRRLLTVHAQALTARADCVVCDASSARTRGTTSSPKRSMLSFLSAWGMWLAPATKSNLLAPSTVIAVATRRATVSGDPT